MSYRFKRKERIDEGVHRIVTERLDHAVEQLRDKLADDAEGAVHSARKDLKKVRSLLRLVREPLGEKRYRKANRRLRDAGRVLSDARDSTVMTETLAGLESHFDGEIEPAAARGILAWKAIRSSTDDPGTDAAPAAERAASLIERARSASMAGLDDDAESLVAAGLKRGYERGRDALASVEHDPTNEGVHDWRKRVKDLWYQLRLVRKSWPPVIGETINELHRLADLLGDHHDLSVLRAQLESSDAPPEGTDALVELVIRRQAELLEDALPLGRRIYAEKPKAFVKRLRAYWAEWR